MQLLILAPEFQFAQGEDSGRKRPARVRTSFPVSEVVSMMLGICTCVDREGGVGGGCKGGVGDVGEKSNCMRSLSGRLP